MAYFRQGDDPDKRKGELNVLMSRPKVRAYHYLHGKFDNLKHDTASITDYLWRTYQAQNEQRTKLRSELANTITENSYLTLQGSSGQSMFSIMSYLLEYRSVDFTRLFEPYFSTVIGNPKQKVDLMMVPVNNSADKSIAVIDVSGFENTHSPAEETGGLLFSASKSRAVGRSRFRFCS